MMKNYVQHILLSGAVAAILAAASSAQANVDVVPEKTAIYSAPAALMEGFAPSANDTANQPIIKLAQKKISASKAKKIARSRVRGGEVVDVSLRASTYKVRVIAKNGRVVDVLIDANTGRVK